MKQKFIFQDYVKGSILSCKGENKEMNLLKASCVLHLQLMLQGDLS